MCNAAMYKKWLIPKSDKAPNETNSLSVMKSPQKKTKMYKLCHTKYINSMKELKVVIICIHNDVENLKAKDAKIYSISGNI